VRFFYPARASSRSKRVYLARDDSPTTKVALLLFGSGACSLVYETVWRRELRLVFGAWDEGFLTTRRDGYKAQNDPRGDRAEDDLEEWGRGHPTPFAEGLDAQ
jgi:hypothetical protein